MTQISKYGDTPDGTGAYVDDRLTTACTELYAAQAALYTADTSEAETALTRVERALEDVRIVMGDLVDMARAALEDKARMKDELQQAWEELEAVNDHVESAYDTGFEAGAEEGYDFAAVEYGPQIDRLQAAINTVRTQVTAAFEGDESAVEHLAEWARTGKVQS